MNKVGKLPSPRLRVRFQKSLSRFLPVLFLSFSFSLEADAQTTGILLTNDFEVADGVSPGLLNQNASFTIISGAVSVSRFEVWSGRQSIELRAGLPVAEVEYPLPLPGGSTLTLEIMAKPDTGDPAQPTEFLDFGGARVGFFPNESTGEIYVADVDSLFTSRWLDTGFGFPLAAGGLSTNKILTLLGKHI